MTTSGMTTSGMTTSGAGDTTGQRTSRTAELARAREAPGG